LIELWEDGRGGMDASYVEKEKRRVVGVPWMGKKLFVLTFDVMECARIEV